MDQTVSTYINTNMSNIGFRLKENQIAYTKLFGCNFRPVWLCSRAVRGR